jgi:glycosyltransferase involved in cell wall biosynthesis
MATYDGAAFVGEQLRSFVDQTRRPDELIVSDDGSTDGTIAILEEFRASAPFPVTILTSPVNRGYSKNFESALAYASGDIIFMSDQDDVWFPHKIERVLAAFDGPGVQAVIHNLINAHADLAHEGVTLLDNIIALGFKPGDLIPGCATAIRRSWLDCALPIPGEIAYDAWLNGLAHKVGARKVIGEPLAFYRRHGNTAFQWVASLPVAAEKRLVPQPPERIDARTRWANEARILGLYVDRLEGRAEFWESAGLAAGAGAALSAMKHRRFALEERIQARGQKRLRRLPTIAKMLGRGQYRHFAGLRGALKDAIR